LHREHFEAAMARGTPARMDPAEIQRRHAASEVFRQARQGRIELLGARMDHNGSEFFWWEFSRGPWKARLQLW
jgi:hypothetical protein